MTLFFLYTAGIVALVLAAAYSGVRGQRDTLHPGLVIGGMLLFLYAYMPMRLYLENGFFGYITEDQLGFAQLVNLCGVGALVGGVTAGAWGGLFREADVQLPRRGGRIYAAGLVVGLAGVLGYVIGIVATGGFSEAYGRAYGGGWSESGYVRELFLMTAPAILLILASGQLGHRPLRWWWVVLFGAPLLIQGLLGARRGPTFVVLVTVLAGYYLIRARRPALVTVLAGGSALGLLMLFLVSNRESIYLGSDFRFENEAGKVLDAGAGNEFIYGAGSVVTANEVGQYFWGGRYATVLFVRPIPRSLWPGKYEFAKRTFGADVEVNMGVDYDAMAHVMGWVGAIGAAPGLVADMFMEFSWGMVAVLFLIGYFFGRSWRNSVMRGGIWIVVYGVALSLSVYLVMQTLEAFIFRLLFMLAPVWWAARYAGLGNYQRRESGGPVRAAA